ncbi:Kelch-type beta propeller [Cordyceps fumosorosea ARSEF 2679]|uniref:Trimethylguanosine synthase n=1 Tax=Cordyceps fumosorosea (strain ARSEF 2679) TaxID=1081104 RepID=A0A167XCP7_CORFA|nr:Kelch-type beta propeller [Cordyceps fumosorosea ARSEF 2679]OAA64811.1 Kelch-type beta propeller [Cordyceps fumosorosea ARSEF 2679]
MRTAGEPNGAEPAYDFEPAGWIDLTDGCHHYQGTHEVPWDIQKYFSQRYSIFSYYDDGICMTDDAWFGVTPEPVAKKIAEEMQSSPKKNRILIDLFCGAGGNTIAFALSERWDHIISIERDAATLACAQNNASVYEIDDGYITWVHGDSFAFLKTLFNNPSALHPDLRVDLGATILFASPPWGGPGYPAKLTYLVLRQGNSIDMGAKDKKKNTDAKKAKKAEKQAKQASKGEKKAKSKQAKIEGSDAEDVDLDEVLEEYRRAQEQFLKVTETVCDAPPRPRAASTILASPTDSNNLLLFGGEYFNGSLAHFYNDLHIYNIARDEWRCVTSPNAPLPRSGHAWTRAANPHHVYLFGGEFSSPKQGTFHHYADFWRLEPATREWTKIEVRGKDKSPPARSGHRMTYWKHYVILFGGFQDTSNQTKYLADLWVFDTVNFVWHNPALPPAQLKPDARSSFTLLPSEHGAVLFGGYSRVKATVALKKKAGNGGQGASGGGQKNVLVPKVHEDCFFLRMALPAADAGPNAPPTVRWEKRKKPANTPSPSRAGATMTYHKGRGILFGGVHDVEASEDGMESEFFNQLANEEELLRQLAALETGASLEDADDIELEKKEEEREREEQVPVKEMPVTMEPPHMRFNAQLTVQNDVLYIYGGTFEKADREFTFDDLYAIDLVKLDGCKEIFTRPVEDWVESEDEDDEDDEYDDEEEEDEDEDEDEDEEPKQQLYTPSKRGKKKDDDTVSEATAASETTEDDDDAETSATSVDDGLPHPRPFESRRDFFVRTSAEWQEILLTNLRWKNIQPETMAIKEIKAKAFELSEEKWWDCREEITTLEEEQEAAGIQEVVSLAERGDAGGGARRR